MAEGKFGMKDGTEYLPHFNPEMGMNDDLAYADRAGWNTSVEMLTGGSPHDWTDFSSIEVGNPYDLDAMGEDRSDISYMDSMAKGHIGGASMESGAGMQENAGAAMTTGGKSTHLAPQNYNSVGKMKKD